MPRSSSGFLPGLLRIAPLLGLAACGGGSDGSKPKAPAAIRTLAYVVTDCHEDATSASISQRLEILRDDQPPVTVMEIPTVLFPSLGMCPLFGAFGAGINSVLIGALQRLGVSPDGSGVVFEVTFEFSLLTALGVSNPLRPDEEGIFFVRADGSGLRRLGPPSREASQRLIGLCGISSPNGCSFFEAPFFSFSPDGNSITFMDRGPGPAGEDAPQVTTLDIASGTRTLVTELPDAPPDPRLPAAPATGLPAFSDDDTIQFFSRASPKNLNLEGALRGFTVKTDGTGLDVLPVPVAPPGSVFLPNFFITRSVTNAEVTTLLLPGTPVNENYYFPPDSIYNTISEIFVLSPDHTLQLTNFRRVDTGGTNLGLPTSLSSDGQHVFFVASADPLGTNPSENCQVFSIDALGTNLRQLTQFRAADHSAIGCGPIPELPGCSINGGPIIDAELRTLVIDTECDPRGTKLNGAQYFAMHADGTGLRQLTATRGVVTAADGSVDVELPGPGAYSATGFGGLF